MSDKKGCSKCYVPISSDYSSFIFLLKTPPERREHTNEYLEYRNKLGNLMLRPIAVLATVVWLGFGLKIDPVLHPDFPGLLYFRGGLSVVGIISFLLSFTTYFQKRSLLLLHLMHIYAFLSCSLFTGRLADDPNYVAGLQILIMISALAPFTFRTILLYFSISIVLFIGTALVYRTNLVTYDAYYSMNNLGISYVLGIIFGYVIDRHRFNVFLKKLKLREIAMIDTLTRVYNRRYFLNAMELQFQQSVRYNQPISIIMMDLDHFKKINDKYGHAGGDYVLKEFARICNDNIRKVDLLGRLGGEEFAILLPVTDTESARIVAERIRETFNQQLFEYEDFSFHATVSIGIACFPETYAKSSNDLLNKADKLLYLAKNEGRNRVC